MATRDPQIIFPGGTKSTTLQLKQSANYKKKGVSRYLKSIGLHTHIEATTALSKNYISASTFESYYSFCFIRNPWDHALSQFFELKKDKRLQSLDLDTFIEDGTLENFATSCRSIYSDQGKIIVKHLYRYENLQDTIQSIFNDLNLTGNPQLPRAKTNLRTDKRPYKDLLNSNQKIKIERIFAQEIEWGKYHF